MPERQKAFVAIFTGALLGGATAAVTKIGLLGIPPLSFVFLRFLIASLLLAPFVLKKGKNLKYFTGLVPISLLATFNIIVFILGIKTTTATIGQLLYAATPFLTAIILYLIYKEKLSIIKGAGIVIGFIGTAVVIVLPVIENQNPFSGNLLGNFLIAAGVATWSFYMVFSKRLLKNYSPLEITSGFIFTTALVSLPLFIFDTFANNGWWINLDFNSVLAFAYVTIVSTIVTYFLNQYAIKHGGSVFASMVFYLLPIFAFFFAFLLLGEGLTIGLVAGGILVLLGIYLTTGKK